MKSKLRRTHLGICMLVSFSASMSAAEPAQRPHAENKAEEKQTVLHVIDNGHTLASITLPPEAKAGVTADQFIPDPESADRMLVKGNVKIHVDLNGTMAASIVAKEVLLTKVLVVTAMPQNDHGMKETLELMLESDQSVRGSIDPLSTQSSSHISADDWATQEKIDAKNLQDLLEIVRKYGWPKRSVVGDAASQGAFLVLQHAPIDEQIRLLPTIKSMAKEGEVKPEYAALLEDRVLVGSGKKQRYGTQVQMTKDGPIPYPIEDAANVNARRRELGLPLLEDYLKLMTAPREE